MIRTLCIAALAACAAAQSISDIDAEISRLNALRNQATVRRNAENPKLVTADDNLVVRLPRSGDLTVERRQTISVADLEARLANVETAGLPSVGAAARVDAREAAFNATLTLMASQTSRIDTLVATVAGFQGSLASITSTVNAASSTMRVNNERDFSTMRLQNGAQMVTQNAAVTAALNAMNASVAAAVVVARAAGSPTVYVQWGTKLCTAPGGVTVVKLYDGITYGSRHNDQGGGSTNMCLKNAAGDQGGHRVGGQDSNDMVVPIKRDHSGYTGLPSRNNLLQSRDGHIIPCAKCKYAKSCFQETGVAECPSGYHKMYTGYMFGGHQTHRGNNDRFCVDKNPQNNDYTATNNWQGYVYPTLARSGLGNGLLRGNRVALACHQCCVH